MTSSSSISGRRLARGRRAPRVRPAGARAAPRRCSPGSRRRAARAPRGSAARSSRCGPWPLKPRSRSLFPRAVELFHEDVSVRGASSAGDTRRRGSPSSPSSAARAMKGSAPRLDRGRPVRHQGGSMARQLAVPRRRASRGPRPPGAHAQAAARCAARAPAHRRVGVRDARRPQRRDELVHVRAPQRRSALHELQAVRQEDAHKRTAGDVEQPLHSARRRPYMRFGSPGVKPTLSSCRPSGASVVTSTRTTRLTEAHQLAFVRRARGSAPGVAEVERVEQVRLAGAVAALDEGHAGAELDVGGPRSCGSCASRGARSDGRAA